MASDFRPRVTGNPTQDESNRLAFDYIYQLRSRLDNLPKATTTVVQTVSANNNSAPSSAPASSIVWGENVLSVSSGNVTPDMSLGVFQVVTLGGANVTVNNPVNSAGSGQPMCLVMVQDVPGGNVIFRNSYVPSAVVAQTVVLSGVANTYSIALFYQTVGVQWRLWGFYTGIANG